MCHYMTIQGVAFFNIWAYLQKQGRINRMEGFPQGLSEKLAHSYKKQDAGHQSSKKHAYYLESYNTI